jgi:hypothetical protein
MALAFRTRVGTIDRLFDGTISLDEVNANDHRVAVTAALFLLAMLALIPVWLVWFHALYRDAGTFRRVRYPAWPVWGWLVPVLSLFRPKQMVNDAWMAGDARYDDNTAPPRMPFLVQAWWATWLGGSVVASVRWSSSRTRRPTFGDQLDMLRTTANVMSVACALLAVSALLGIFLVRTLSRRLERRHAERAVPAPGY